MLAELLRNILNEHRNYMSLSELENILDSKKVKVKIRNYLSHSSLFTVSEGFVFLKKALVEMKNEFLEEFEGYISSKSIDTQAAKNLRMLFAGIVPDLFYPEWHDLGIENKLSIFDLLLSLLVRNKNQNLGIKKYFGELIDLYSMLSVYTIILIKNNEEDIDKITGYLSAVDSEEEMLKNMIFEVLINPSSVSPVLDKREKELSAILLFIDKVIDASFRVSMSYSQQILKKVVTNELNRFEPLYILSRFDFESIYEWVLAYLDGQDSVISDKLLQDLDM